MKLVICQFVNENGDLAIQMVSC